MQLMIVIFQQLPLLSAAFMMFHGHLCLFASGHRDTGIYVNRATPIIMLIVKLFLVAFNKRAEITAN